MPASYAHYRFGRQVLSALPASERQCVQRFRRLYDMGLFGPDIFFYYHPLIKTAAGELDNAFHSQTGRDFFAQACTQANTEAARAYLYGLLAHYCLDTACWPYVRKQEERPAALAAEFDRFLLEADGLNAPHDLSAHMKITRGECVTVASFYPPATPAHVNASVHCMSRMSRFLAGKNRKRTEKLLKLTKKQQLTDLLPPAEADEKWKRSNSELLARYSRAVKQYPILLRQLTQHQTGGTPLGEDFASPFRAE